MKYFFLLSFILIGCAGLRNDLSCKISWIDGKDTVFTCTRTITEKELRELQEKKYLQEHPPEEPPDTDEVQPPTYKYHI